MCRGPLVSLSSQACQSLWAFLSLPRHLQPPAVISKVSRPGEGSLLVGVCDGQPL